MPLTLTCFAVPSPTYNSTKQKQTDSVAFFISMVPSMCPTRRAEALQAAYYHVKAC